MTAYDFDRLPDRRGTNSGKWHTHPADVLPMFVADMDFVSPEPVVQALREYVTAGVFGYPRFDGHLSDSPALREVVVERLARQYGWRVTPEALVFVPGVVTGFNLAAYTVAAPGGELVVQTPIYSPMLETARHAGMARRDAPLGRDRDGRYCIDWETFRPRSTRPRACSCCATPTTRPAAYSGATC